MKIKTKKTPKAKVYEACKHILSLKGSYKGEINLKDLREDKKV